MQNKYLTTLKMNSSSNHLNGDESNDDIDVEDFNFILSPTSTSNNRNFADFT